LSSRGYIGRVPSNDQKAATPAGAQTLARGLTALQLICDTSGGLTIQEVAEQLDVHRTVAARLLATLGQFHLVARHEGRYRPGAGLPALGASFDNNLREVCIPILRKLADNTLATASLLVAEGEEQVAIAVIVPFGVSYHLSFREGSRYPLDRGSAGLALLSGAPPQPDERAAIAEARERGWVLTHGEVEPNAYGLAVPVKRTSPSPLTAINLVSHRPDVLEEARPKVTKAAGELADLLA
jgi:DNA-binding IclR family transcriptional regulator